jgi:hypothetical protein
MIAAMAIVRAVFVSYAHVLATGAGTCTTTTKVIKTT